MIEQALRVCDYFVTVGKGRTALELIMLTIIT